MPWLSPNCRWNGHLYCIGADCVCPCHSRKRPEPSPMPLKNWWDEAISPSARQKPTEPPCSTCGFSRETHDADLICSEQDAIFWGRKVWS